MADLPGCICVSFGFVKGALVGQSFTVQVAADVSVSHLKQSLIQTHNACDPITQSLKFVCEQTLKVLSDDEKVGNLKLPRLHICVSVTKKCASSVASATVQPQADCSSHLRKHHEAAPSPDCPASLSSNALNPCSTAAADSNHIHDGARVRIEGLRSKPELNGHCGAVCGAFNAHAGRWLVRLDMSVVGAICDAEKLCVLVKPENLQIIPLQQSPHPPPCHLSPTLQPKTKAPHAIAIDPSASALSFTTSGISSVMHQADDQFVMGANLSHDQQRQMSQASRAMQEQQSVSGQIDMSAFLSVYENVRKPEDKAIDSIFPISTMVCLHR